MSRSSLIVIIKKELTDVWLNKKSRIIFIMIILISILDVGLVYLPYILHPESLSKASNIWHPSVAAFLNGGSHGHVPQMLLMWLLPFYLLLLYADSHVMEHKLGYDILLVTRVNRRKLFRGKMISGFIVGSVTMMSCLLVNFIICLILFRNGENFTGLELYSEGNHWLLRVSLNHPIVIYLLYIIVSSIVAGLCCVMCTALSFIFENYKLLYTVSILIWIVLISYEYNVTYIMQPFIEYGLEMIVVSFAVFLAMVISTGITGYYFGVKRDTL